MRWRVRTSVERRYGICRTVVLTRRYAIKIPRLRRYRDSRTGAVLGDGSRGLLWRVARGVLANQAEAEWWRHGGERTRSCLCPVLRSWLGGLVNVYPRCAPYEVDTETELRMFRREFRPVPDLEPQPGDNKSENYGVTPDGRVVLLDYDMNWNGCPHDRSGTGLYAPDDAGRLV